MYVAATVKELIERGEAMKNSKKLYSALVLASYPITVVFDWILRFFSRSKIDLDKTAVVLITLSLMIFFILKHSDADQTTK